MEINNLSYSKARQECKELSRRLREGPSELARLCRLNDITDPEVRAKYVLREIRESIENKDYSGAVVWRIRGFDLPGLDKMDENWVVKLYEKARENGDLFEAFGITQIMFLSWHKKFPGCSESEEGKKVQGLDWENELRNLRDAAINDPSDAAQVILAECARMENFYMLNKQKARK